MRGIGHTLSRLPGLRAFLAGAAIIAGSSATAAYGQESGSGNGSGALKLDGTRADEVAFAYPRIYQGHGAQGIDGSVALPQPLSPGDAALTRRILALQAKGNIPEAIRTSADLHDTLLSGALLADRYLGRNRHATAAELSDWLSKYGDQPDAPAIRALLVAKLPKGAPVPPMPENASLSRSAEPAVVPREIATLRNNLAQPVAAENEIIEHGDAAQPMQPKTSARGLPRSGAARSRAETARGLFIRNEDAAALRIVEESIRDISPDRQNSLTYYVGGLAAWRMQRFEQARRLFESGAEAANTSPRLRAASAFWASRANQKLQRAVATVRWLKLAAEERTSFHGILARRILRLDIGFVPGGELLTDADVDAVAETSSGLRAFALLQVGRPERAEAELRALWPRIQADPVFGRSVLLVASATGLNELASQLAGLLRGPDAQRADELSFPVPRLRPSGGFRVDPSLVYALARMESNFDSDATSPCGATGLMQIMPATASYVVAGLGGAGDRLHDPGFNLEIGQRYVSYLARQDGIDGDLMRLLAGYNGGPGNILHWIGDIRDDDDPLLFIEAIPVAETRNFVADVLAASWIYAARLHRPAPSLDSLAAGEFPRFTPLARESKMTNVALRLN
jgi:soluble lytic murein transglycosylase